ncbi:hypothetical protein [Serratia quinivorans]|uniref:hypothetical protein n=1 Tax=Serratia quinivorans TaxID=137545 RepID=UPI00217B25E7|nr:hypothetical protein [Serratia quinivorans]CAI0734954.1 Uncharacterised protein [Serratia quinivorans]CAI0738546.1 Uncharacterised protein [Serratia quinivorans]CAI0760276.1 Uncharacterised protein [Serratia quinivorans]CAI1669024.1 Uncharacterised protein [Serratia quinivorans]CAI2051496.1 Uncharacterised protein [Serratia quinivorans]
MNAYFMSGALRRSLMMGMVGSFLLLGGCTASPEPRLPPQDAASIAAAPMNVTPIAASPNATPETPAAMEKDSKVAQCNNELAALKTVNAAHYARYRSEMDHLVASGRRYMEVKTGISNDINDIMTPRYQYGMARLCWGIRNALSQSLMAQADIPQGRGQ